MQERVIGRQAGIITCRADGVEGDGEAGEGHRLHDAGNGGRRHGIGHGRIGNPRLHAVDQGVGESGIGSDGGLQEQIAAASRGQHTVAGLQMVDIAVIGGAEDLQAGIPVRRLPAIERIAETVGPSISRRDQGLARVQILRLVPLHHGPGGLGAGEAGQGRIHGRLVIGDGAIAERHARGESRVG